jgi:hypothetical protein
MSAPEHPAWQHIEPEAMIAIIDEGTLRTFAPGEHAIELSKAISLKRIADALAPEGGDSVAFLLGQIGLNGIPRG